MLIEGPGYYGPPQSRSATKATKGALSLANTTAATYQTCLMLPTTLTAVMGASLTPVVAAGSMYRGARNLNFFYSLGTRWHSFITFTKIALPKLRSELSLAIATTATYEKCLMSSTILTAVMGVSLTPVVAAGSIYRCARILSIFCSVSII